MLIKRTHGKAASLISGIRENRDWSFTHDAGQKNLPECVDVVFHA